MTTQTNGGMTSTAEERDEVRRRIRRKAGRVRRELADTVDQKVHAARRGVRRGVYNVEDRAAQLAGRIRRAPLSSVLIGAAAGLLIGASAALIGQHCRTRELA